jgi:hypothetical protein
MQAEHSFDISVNFYQTTRGNVPENRIHSHRPKELKSAVDRNTVELTHNDIGLYDTSSIASDILWYRLTPHC